MSTCSCINPKYKYDPENVHDMSPLSVLPGGAQLHAGSVHDLVLMLISISPFNTVAAGRAPANKSQL